jgi:hypothetical protein
VIRNVQSQLSKELQEELSLTAGYLSSGEVARILVEVGGDVHPEVLERTFIEQFVENQDGRFEKTLFRYLLNKLAAIASLVAVDYAVDALRQHPEETAYILRYLGAVGIAGHQYDKLVSYMESPEAIYDYQLYQVIRWHFDTKRVDDRVLELARRAVADRNRPQWLRSTAAAYLGHFGRDADLEFMEESYAQATSDVERADCLAALARLERSRRNALYQRVKGDGVLVDRSIVWVSVSRT